MSWLSIAPPIIVFILGCATKRICLSLFVGVLTASLIASNFMPIETMTLVANGIWTNTKISYLFSPETFAGASNFFIITFVLCLGILIEMIRRSNAATAFVDFVESSIRSPKAAETSTLLLSHCLSIDDYLSSLTTGSVMRHLTDKFRIPRVKLAFLTDSMAAPLVMLTPISSWSAAVIGFLTENGVHASRESETLLLANPYSVYLNILPYIFYSTTLIASVWLIVRFRLSFGTMHDHEVIAQQTGNLIGGKPDENKEETEGPHTATIIDFFVPIGTLLSSTVVYILGMGGFWMFGGDKSFLGALQNAPISLVLFASGLTALSISVVYFLSRKMFSLGGMLKVAKEGVVLMFPVCVILIFSWTMGDLLRQNLKTGEWLASLFTGMISVTFMPLILFLNASLISLALGSSWATTAIMLPIAIPMVMSMNGVVAPASIDQLPVIFPVFGAILSGAVCGDHISLISETTIMATTSAMCDQYDHFKTQLVYALPTFIGTGVAFLISGFLFNTPAIVMLGVCFASALTVSFSMLFGMHFYKKYRERAVTA